MARFGFVGPAYQSQSVNADAQICKNWFVEAIESGQGKSGAVLYPCPGLQLAYQLSSDPIRGAITVNNRSFAVSGTKLFELLSNGTFTSYAGLANDGATVSMAAGPKQILIISAGIGYVFTLATNVLAQIAPAMQIGPWAQAGYSDGFFIALLRSSNIFQISNLLDAATWDITQSTQVSLFPDNVVTMIVDHREIWLGGLQKSVAYANYGVAPFPFLPIPGAYLELGSIAAYGAVRIDNSVFWIGQDERGAGMAWRAQGYSPVRISNHAIETAWQGYPTISDAIAYAYQDSGHSFYVVSFPVADKTWVYDVATGMWHERGFWNANAGIFNAHRARFHTYNFGKHLVGDYTTGSIYTMATSIFNDFGNYIRRVRRAPHISSEQEWIFHHQLQVDAETGTGGFTLPGIFFRDTNGQIWLINITDGGVLQTTKVTAGVVTPAFLNDSTNAASWQVIVTVGGIYSTISVAFNATYPKTILLTSQSGFSYWNLGVTLGGVLTTTKVVGTPNITPSGEPQFMLRWSDDGGHTWSNEYMVSAGAVGNYKARAIWRRLGRSRDRVYELAVSDNAAWRLIDSYLQASPGYGPTERLATQMRKSA